LRGRAGHPGRTLDLDGTTKEYAELCKQYRIRTVTGDYYAGEWVTAACRRDNGITYQKADLPASGLYLEALPLFVRGLVALPDHPTLLRELRLLERTPTRMGKDQVTHPRGCHDDYANATCGALRGLARYLGYDLYSGWLDDDDDKAAVDAQYRNQFAARIFQLSGGQCWPR
jgi:hypothetical protein